MRTDSASEIWTQVHPVLMPWFMPLMMAQWWTHAVMSAMPRADEPDRAREGAQLRVPGLLQQSRDRELFA